MCLNYHAKRSKLKSQHKWRDLYDHSMRFRVISLKGVERVISLKDVMLSTNDRQYYISNISIKNLVSSPQQAQPKTASRNICLGMDPQIELMTLKNGGDMDTQTNI